MGIRMRVGKRCLAAGGLAGLLLGACGQPPEAPDFWIRGVGVKVRTDAPFARHPDFPARVESTVETGLAYWGGSWRDLDGTTVHFEGSATVACGENASAVGCYDGDIRVSTVDAGTTFSCVEQTALVHEVGHAVIGDAAHLDPRWLDFDAVAQALAGRSGYGATGEVPCILFPSVWKHPPDAAPGSPGS
jgi:hypothetical protein